MYPHFIEIHDKEGGATTVNIDHIVSFNDHHIQLSIMHVNCAWDVQETYEELKQLITDSGCLIQKGDPRLDTSHPLMMKDIEEMKSGEPVWNSNRNEWYLLRTMTEDGEVWFSDFVGSKVIATEELLIKTPLYRMKMDNDRLYIPDGYTQSKTGDKNHE